MSHEVASMRLVSPENRKSASKRAALSPWFHPGSKPLNIVSEPLLSALWPEVSAATRPLGKGLAGQPAQEKVRQNSTPAGSMHRVRHQGQHLLPAPAILPVALCLHAARTAPIQEPAERVPRLGTSCLFAQTLSLGSSSLQRRQTARHPHLPPHLCPHCKRLPTSCRHQVQSAS